MTVPTAGVLVDLAAAAAAALEAREREEAAASREGRVAAARERLAALEGFTPDLVAALVVEDVDGPLVVLCDGSAGGACLAVHVEAGEVAWVVDDAGWTRRAGVGSLADLGRALAGGER